MTMSFNRIILSYYDQGRIESLAGTVRFERTTRRLTIAGSAAELRAKIVAVFYLMVIRTEQGIEPFLLPTQACCLYTITLTI